MKYSPGTRLVDNIGRVLIITSNFLDGDYKVIYTGFYGTDKQSLTLSGKYIDQYYNIVHNGSQIWRELAK